MSNTVVVHYLDGKIEKGYATDFRTDKEAFHLVTAEVSSLGQLTLKQIMRESLQFSLQ